MKKLLFLIVSVGCLHAMDRHAVHSADPGVPLRNYWQSIAYLDPLIIPDPDVVRVFYFIRDLVQKKPAVLLYTPRAIARQYFAKVYRVIHNGQIVWPDKQVIEETGGTVEGILCYLNKLIKHDHE